MKHLKLVKSLHFCIPGTLKMYDNIGLVFYWLLLAIACLPYIVSHADLLKTNFYGGSSSPTEVSGGSVVCGYLCFHVWNHTSGLLLFLHVSVWLHLLEMFYVKKWNHILIYNNLLTIPNWMPPSGVCKCICYWHTVVHWLKCENTCTATLVVY
jgi:hypothetical protein